MKLSLIFEMDGEIRKWSRAAASGDHGALENAMRNHARARSRSTWKEPGVNKQSKNLKSHGQNWRLESYPFTVSYNSSQTTRNQAIEQALRLLQQNHIDTGDFNIYDEEEDDPSGSHGHDSYLGVDIAVSTSFIERLLVSGDMEWETDDGAVFIDVQV